MYKLWYSENEKLHDFKLFKKKNRWLSGDRAPAPADHQRPRLMYSSLPVFSMPLPFVENTGSCEPSNSDVLTKPVRHASILYHWFQFPNTHTHGSTVRYDTVILCLDIKWQLLELITWRCISLTGTQDGSKPNNETSVIDRHSWRDLDRESGWMMIWDLSWRSKTEPEHQLVSWQVDHEISTAASGRKPSLSRAAMTKSFTTEPSQTDASPTCSFTCSIHMDDGIISNYTTICTNNIIT